MKPSEVESPPPPTLLEELQTILDRCRLHNGCPTCGRNALHLRAVIERLTEGHVTNLPPSARGDDRETSKQEADE